MGVRLGLLPVIGSIAICCLHSSQKSLLSAVGRLQRSPCPCFLLLHLHCPIAPSIRLPELRFASRERVCCAAFSLEPSRTRVMQRELDMRRQAANHPKRHVDPMLDSMRAPVSPILTRVDPGCSLAARVALSTCPAVLDNSALTHLQLALD